MRKTAVYAIFAAVIITGSAPAMSAGASSDYGKVYCSYLKTRAMAAKTADKRRALMAEYKRCLKEHGEG